MKSWSVCILDKHHPLLAHISPLGCHSTAKKQIVNITMTVRLCLNQAISLIDRELGRIIDQSRDVLLLHKVNLGSFHAKEVVSLEQGHCPIVSIIRDHDTEGHNEVLAK